MAVLAAHLGSAAAFETDLDRRALEEALSIGQSVVESVRTRFHQPYRIAGAAAPLDYVEVITPFRKIVLAAEAQARAGSRRFSLREAQETLGDGNELTVHVELTFHPLNTFIGLPPYGAVLVEGQQSIAPETLDRIPRFGPRVEGAPPRGTATAGALLAQKNSQPMTGGTLVAKFRTPPLKPHGVYELRVMEGQAVLAKTRIDFARLR
jgi:hypothetical protein